MAQQADVEAQSLVADVEIAAERTVARLRMAIALALGVTFLLAVGPSAEAAASFPPLRTAWAAAISVMIGYFLLGAAEALFISFGRYRSWMAWAAATADVAFFVFNAWLSLRNSGIPANYLTAMPAFSLAPIALAFGALRFNPLLQAYAVSLMLLGAVASALLAPAWTFDSAQGPPDRLAYYFSLPPNIMRLAMLAMAGGVLVFAAIRARRLLVRAVSEARAHAALTRFLPSAIAGEAAGGGLAALRRGDRRTMAVLFTDMRGFTRFTQTMAPDEIGAFVTEHRRRLSRAAAAEGGVIDKFVGDAALVVFGLDRPGTPAHDHRRHAAAALSCAERIVSEMADWSRVRAENGEEPVRVGVGVHYGEVYCGAIGDDARLEYTVLGDTVNVASRLEALTKSLERPVVASADVIDAAGVSVASSGWLEIEPVTLSGRDGALRLYASQRE